MKVVDGDSLQLKDGRRIRLLAIDAPEKDRCLYDEARKRLQQMAEGKRLKIENMLTDDYGRILANVFVGSTFVNKIMVQEGLAKFSYVRSPYYDELKQTSQLAKEKKTRHLFFALPQSSANCRLCNKGKH